MPHRSHLLEVVANRLIGARVAQAGLLAHAQQLGEVEKE